MTSPQPGMTRIVAGVSNGPRRKRTVEIGVASTMSLNNDAGAAPAAGTAAELRLRYGATSLS